MTQARSEQIKRFFQMITLFYRLEQVNWEKRLCNNSVHFSRPQMELLFHLENNKTMTIKEISTKMVTSSSAATQIVENLIKSGFLEKMPDKDDQRLVHVKFTKSGKTKFTSLKKMCLNNVEQILSVLTDKELESLNKIGGKTLYNLQNLVKTNTELCKGVK